MEPYSISAVIQLYSAGLISRAALEQEASTYQSRAKQRDTRVDHGRREDAFLDLCMDANGVWRLN